MKFHAPLHVDWVYILIHDAIIFCTIVVITDRTRVDNEGCYAVIRLTQKGNPRKMCHSGTKKLDPRKINFPRKKFHPRKITHAKLSPKRTHDPRKFTHVPRPKAHDPRSFSKPRNPRNPRNLAHSDFHEHLQERNRFLPTIQCVSKRLASLKLCDK